MSDSGSTNPSQDTTSQGSPADPAQPQYFDQGGQGFGGQQGQPSKKKMGTGGKVAIGCGVLFLLGLLGIGGCTAAFAIWGDDAAEDFNQGLEEGFNESLGQTSGVDVTLEEFERVQNGMSRSEVESIFGAAGAETSSNAVGDSTITTYNWDGNTTFSTATVTFDNDVVTGKFQTGLE